MVYIILLVLKILGLLLLVVLGLILLVLLLVLFVPLRYRVEGSYNEKVKGKAKVSWLLHLISVTLSYEEDFIMTVRLFGFRILKPKKMDHELREAGEIMVQTMEVKPEEALEDVKEEIQKRPENRIPPSKEENLREEAGRTSWFLKLKVRIRKQLLKLKFFFHRICDTLKTVKDKKEKLQAWVSNKENQKTMKLFLRQLKKLIRHILPRRGKGDVTFGFDDPYMTGQILTYASVIYPFCHKHLNLYPVFDQAVFKAEGNFRGRVRIGTVLAVGGRMLLHKNFRVLLKKWIR